MKPRFLHLDDYQALETDVYLTALIYTRIKASRMKWLLLSVNIYHRKLLFMKENLK